MSEKLDNDVIREWWKKISSHAQEAGLKDYQGIHEPIKFPMLVNKYRVMVGQIRNEPAYNYLCSLGVEVNHNGEIFLTEDEAIGYIEMQKIFMEGT